MKAFFFLKLNFSRHGVSFFKIPVSGKRDIFFGYVIYNVLEVCNDIML